MDCRIFDVRRFFGRYNSQQSTWCGTLSRTRLFKNTFGVPVSAGKRFEFVIGRA